MFVSFGEKLNSIDDSFANAKGFEDHKAIIIHCGELVEKCFLYLFQEFHTTLTSNNDKRKFLEFEKKKRNNNTQFKIA